MTTPPKKTRLPQNLLEKLFQLLFFLTPLLLSPKSFEVFELPKMLFVYLLTTLIVSTWIIRSIKEQRLIFQKTFLDLPLLLFLTSQLASTFISTDRHTSIFGYYSRLNGGLLSTLCYSLLYWALTSNFSLEKRKKIILIPSLTSGFLISIYAILEHFGIDKDVWIQDVQNRVFSTLGQPNWLAAYLSVLIPFTLFPLLRSLEKKENQKIILYITLLTSYTLALLFTKSKSGFLASLFSLSLLFFFKLLKTIQKKTLKKGFLPLLAIPITFLTIFLLIGTPYTPSLKEFLKKSPPPEIQTQPGEMPLNITSSQDIRLIVWKGALNLWKKYPLFGTGTETFAYSYYWVRPQEHNLTSEWDFLYNKAHNEYLNFLATTGTLGLLTYLLLPFAVIIKIIKKPSLENLSLLAAYAGILITNFFGFSVVTISLFFFLLPALITKEKPKDQFSPSLESNIKKDILTFLTIFIALRISLNVISYYQADLNYQESRNLRQMGQSQKAQEKIEKAIHLFPSEPNYYSESSLIYSQLALSETENQVYYIQKAIIASDQSVKISPTHPNLLKTRASLLYTLSTISPQYIDQLITTMEITSQLAPTDAKTFYNLALTYQLNGDVKKAKETFLKTIDLKKNYDQAHFSLAQLYEIEKDLENAKYHYQEALNINPQNQKAKEKLETL